MKWIVFSIGLVIIAFSTFTFLSVHTVPASLTSLVVLGAKSHITDRQGMNLTITYKERWNTQDTIPLHAVPPLLRAAFLAGEDARFYTHGGVDWWARGGAIWQMLRARRAVRGASTITEQVVRLIHPRPRTLWSRWIEGWEAMALERVATKSDILTFYLNQVPYAAQRRGVVQGARYYFGRDLDTLSLKEIVALAVLVRAPSAYDPWYNLGRMESAITRLARKLRDEGILNEADYVSLAKETITPTKPMPLIEARHFARFVHLQGASGITTLDGTLQGQIQALTTTRLKALALQDVHNAAVLVVDHRSREILAWVIAGDTAQDIDAVLTPRQAGSVMKPFLYALALDKGWNAATFLQDAPLSEAIGKGLHIFRNYSNTHYGCVTLREALGNSLNIPALLTVRYVGVGEYLTTLGHLGFTTLTRSSDIYAEGLALGSGEVRLYDMVGAYTALANGGVWRSLRSILRENKAESSERRIYSQEAASLIGNILSDPWARRIEFGINGTLSLPAQVAIKTGTSTDYRDAWTLAYNDRYVVGVWMGNLDAKPMQKITGSTGPAPLVRSIFAILEKGHESGPLYLSPRLIQRDMCIRPVDKNGECPKRSEWMRVSPPFVPEKRGGTEKNLGDYLYSLLSPHVHQEAQQKQSQEYIKLFPFCMSCFFIKSSLPARNENLQDEQNTLEIVRPTQGLHIAYDPRIPAQNQRLRLEVKGLQKKQKITWIMDGTILASGEAPTTLWPVVRGHHTLVVKIQNHTLVPVQFLVK